jgi:hypothetical protein
LFTHRESKTPDHSLLIIEVFVGYAHECRNFIEEDNNVIDSNFEEKRYFYNDLPDDLLNNGLWNTAVNNMIDHLADKIHDQSNIDRLYDNLCTEIFKEVDTKLKLKRKGHRDSKKFKYFKPYWNNRLTNLWNAMKDAELNFVKSRTCNKTKRRLRLVFVNARRAFDKQLRKDKRDYNQKYLIELDNINTTNPQQFWKFLKNFFKYINGLFKCLFQIELCTRYMEDVNLEANSEGQYG